MFAALGCTRENYIKNSCHLLKRNANKQSRQKSHAATTSNGNRLHMPVYMQILLAPPPSPHGTSLPTHTYVRKHLAITLCCFCCWCHSWRRSIGIYKKQKNTAKNFQFKLWLNFARTNAKVATVQILGIYSNLLISRIKCRNRRRVSHKSCLAAVFRVLPCQPACALFVMQIYFRLLVTKDLLQIMQMCQT